jgi:hypothetical protein
MIHVAERSPLDALTAEVNRLVLGILRNKANLHLGAWSYLEASERRTVADKLAALILVITSAR